MPTGAYAILKDGVSVGREEFRCAPGPAGWRWFSTIGPEIIDYTVDRSWRPVRLRLQTEAHALTLTADHERLRGSLDGRELDLPLTDDLDYLSPCFNAVTANRLGGSGPVRPLYVDPATLEPHQVDQTYDLLGTDTVRTPVGTFEAAAWRFRSSGFEARLWVAGDVVVAYEGLFELIEYEPGPAGPFPQR